MTDALREAREVLCDGKCVVTGERKYHAQFCPSFDDSVVERVAAALDERDRTNAELRASLATSERHHPARGGGGAAEHLPALPSGFPLHHLQRPSG